jgi:hypothetical protein
MENVSKAEQLLIVAFLALLVLPVLYLLRGLDDNTLTSWTWVFGEGGLLRTFGLAASGVAIAFFLARTEAIERRPVPFLFLLSFAAVIPLWSEPETILDASRYFLQAKHLELYGVRSFLQEWGRAIGAWTDMPVVPFFYGLIFKYCGETRLPIQIFTTLLFSTTVVLTYLLGRRLWNAETGLYAGLLLPGIPYLLTQVPLMLVDVPTMFFVTLALYAFLDALERGGALRFCLSVFALVPGLFSKYSAPPMLLVLPVIALVHLKRNARETLYGSALVAAAGGVLSAAVFAKADVMKGQIALLRGYQLPGLSRWSEGLASTFFFQVHPFITLLALFAVFAAVKKKDIRFLVPAWFALFALHVERIRYVLPLFPLLTLAAAYGLHELRDREVKRFIALCIVATSLATTLGAYLPFLRTTAMANLERAGRYLDTLPGDSVIVRVQPQRESSGNTEMAIPILDLFTRKRLIYRGEHVSFPDNEAISKSPLRFTWECPLPAFYAGEKTDRCALVALISGDIGPAPPLPCNRGASPVRMRRFTTDSMTFKFKTLVTVYGE